MKKRLVNQLICRFMRIGLLPLLLVLCLAGVMYAKPINGQEILNRKVNLVAEQKEVKSVLTELSKLAEIKFVYSAQRIPVRQKVSVIAHDRRLGEVLDIILQPLNIFYQVTGSQIVLMKRGDDLTGLVIAKTDDHGPAADEYVAKLISGKVTNESGSPLVGVSVLIRGTSRGTTTDAGGNFSITADVGETLEFSMVGYKLFSIKVGAENTVNVTMVAEISNLNEIVVVGYGTQKRSSLTGAVSSVSSKTINELPVASVESALQGRVAGLTVTNNGTPGMQPLVRVRGISSITFASDPLYVIDGFPTGSLANFDSRDIESVEVLKDASSAAIYGSRATNGVIMITTRNGRRDGKLKVSVDSYVGTQSAWKTIDLLNTQQYLTYERALNGAAGIGLPPRLQPTEFNKPIYDGATQTYAQTNTDWQKEYFRPALITQQHLSLSGGNEVSRFYSSAGYFKQEGIAPAVSYERGNFRINSDHRISKMFTFGENLFVSYNNQNYDNTGGNRTGLVNTVRSLPYLPVHDPTTNGGYRNAENSVDGADPTNPIEDAELIQQANRKTLKVFGTAFAEVNFTSWLKFRSVFGVDHSNLFQHQFSPIFSDKGRSAVVSTINDLRRSITTTLFTEQLTFDKTFGDHHLAVTAVYEQQSGNNSSIRSSGNQSSNNIQTLNGATNSSVSSVRTQNFLLSYVGRVNYEFAGKYLVSGAIRRDGLSVWAPGKKWANFPSASVGWRIDQETFMQTVSYVSELKLRAGYGLTGLNGTGLFPALPQSDLANDYPWQAVVAQNGALYPFDNAGGTTTGNASYYNVLANPDLEWETTKQLNIGLDLGLFSNKVTLTADFYNRQTDNLILSVPTAFSQGFGGSGVLANVASMRNTGVDIQAAYNKNKGDFTWNLTGVVSFLRNKVISLNTPNASIDQGGDQDFGGGTNMTRTIAGQPIQSFYGWVVTGIFQTQDEVDKSPVQIAGKTAPGDLKFADLNGDNKITADDRTFLGNYLPKFSYSLSYGARYKNFDLSLFLQGVQGNKVFNAARVITEGMARLFGAGTQVLDAWTPSHTNTSIPRAISGDPNQNVRPSTRWIEDGSYLRLKNIMIGYNVPATTLQSFTKGVVSNLRIYVSSQNLFTITKYKGWDPEIGQKNQTLTNGIDYGQYPVARSFLFGIQASF